MREILIHGLEGRLGGDMPQELLANPHQRRSAAGRQIEPSHELLARRLGGLHWPELQEIFSAAPWQIQVTDLLNLDGGGSAQLYVKAGKFEEMVAGTVEVPVAIGFFSRVN